MAFTREQIQQEEDDVRSGVKVLVRCQSHRSRDRLEASLGGQLPPHWWSISHDVQRGCYAVPVTLALPRGVTRWRRKPAEGIYCGNLFR